MKATKSPRSNKVSIPKLTKQRTCSRCGIILTEQNWPINARKYKGKIWYVCTPCFKEAIANSVYKSLTGITLIKRPKSTHCELCSKPNPKKLSWHHWDDQDTSKGLWLCVTCHYIAETHEQWQDLTQKYLTLKTILENPLRTEMF